MRVTMKDIAARAGVSVATVSNVITQKKYVGAEVESRVRKAMDELHYAPNIIARGLKTSCTYCVGVIVPDNTNIFFADLVQHVQIFLRSRGYQTILMSSDNSVDEEKEAMKSLLAFGVDGIIDIAPRSRMSELDVERDCPIVIIDRPPFETSNNIGFVYSDNYQAAVEIAQYVVDKRYKNFWCLAGPTDIVPNARSRWLGYHDGLIQAGINEDNIVMINTEFTFESGYNITDKLLLEKRISPCTAIFAESDTMAWGVIERIKKEGYPIPDCIGIVGYDDVFYSRFVSPNITTVKTSGRELAKSGAKLLLKAMTEKTSIGGYAEKIDYKILKRNSC